MKTTIRRTVSVLPTPRVKQMQGLFDVAPAKASEQTWDVDLSGLPAEWNVGVIVGPSGAGKTTVARELFGQDLVAGWPWPDDKSILDGFPAGMGIKDITGLLSSVGFSSPPAWLRPFHVLSNGQQFRVNLARTLAEKPGLAVVDEFGSFVHQQVRQVAAAAVAKAVRRRGGQFVAVMCHADAVEYFEPDWIVEVEPGQPVRAKHVRGLVRRPPIELGIFPTTAEA